MRLPLAGVVSRRCGLASARDVLVQFTLVRVAVQRVEACNFAVFRAGLTQKKGRSGPLVSDHVS